MFWPDGTPFVDYAKRTNTYVEELEANFQKFTNTFNDMTKVMVEKMAGGKLEPDEYKDNPVVCSAEEAAQYMVGKKKIAILTGAGISAASGIPTFRG